MTVEVAKRSYHVVYSVNPIMGNTEEQVGMGDLEVRALSDEEAISLAKTELVRKEFLTIRAGFIKHQQIQLSDKKWYDPTTIKFEASKIIGEGAEKPQGVMYSEHYTCFGNSERLAEVLEHLDHEPFTFSPGSKSH